MAEKLTDPNKPAHEIVEVLEDGDAIRNDGVRLTAANKNPWYVLATIYGEHEEEDNYVTFDRGLAAKNRRAWNLWACQGLSDEEREDRAKKLGLTIADLTPHQSSQKAKAELEEITKRFQARMGADMDLPSNEGNSNFTNAIFSKYLNFEKMVFERDAFFNNAVFARDVTFTSAAFLGEAVFIYSTFFGDTHFNFSSFSSSAIFNFAVFMNFTSFGHATFSVIADFSSVTFKSTTRYSDAKFLTYVPEFHAAKLYEDTVFPIPERYTDNWPKLKGKYSMPAADQKRAYNRLRLFMNKSLQIDEEQFFHRQEMRCKTVLAKWYHKPFYWLFSWFSDYGISVWRPLFWMVFVMLSGALFMLWWQEAFTFLPKETSGFDWTLGLLGEDDPWAKPRQAAGWSISNTLPFLGFGKLYYGGEFAANLAWPLKVVGGVQTVAGFILLFFFGLGLRNRFRLR